MSSSKSGSTRERGEDGGASSIAEGRQRWGGAKRRERGRVAVRSRGKGRTERVCAPASCVQCCVQTWNKREAKKNMQTQCRCSAVQPSLFSLPHTPQATQETEKGS